MLLLPRSQRLWISLGCFASALALAVAIDFGADRGPFFQAATAKTDRAGTYDLAKGRFLSRVIGHVRAHYVDPERIAPREMAVAALVAIQRDVPEVMVTVHREKRSNEPVSVEVVADAAKKTFALDRVGDLYELNWKLLEIYDFLERNLPAQADLQNVEFSSVNGLLSTLDPHSLLLPPRIYRELQLGQKGHFGGLGLSIGVDDGILVVMSVMPDTPAAESGVQAGDLILQIDAESTISMTLGEAANLLRGEPGTKITLWLRRDGWDQSKPFELTRREIQVSSVEAEPLADNIGYVHIRNFQETTGEDLRAALAKLQARKGGLVGLVLDLRDNPGGLLDQAIAVSDTFIDHGTIVTTVREGAREREENHATAANTLSELPIVVLINRGSASASEIVAGALKRNDRAVILGERSFGKGSVQVLYKIDEAALKLTIAQYLTPGDVSIQSVGIVPDIAVIPIAVSEDDLDLHPKSADDKGEAGLASHLDNTRAREDIRPAAQVRLVEEGDAQSHLRRRGEGFTEDARVKLAHALLLAAPAPNRKQALIQATGFLARREASEEARLIAELQRIGVDWRAGKTAGKARVELKLDIHGAVAGEPLVAGGKAEIVASLTNTGKTPLFRIHGVFSSSVGALAGKELAFGYVEPGQTVTRTLLVPLPKSLPAIGDRPTLHLYADDVPTDLAVSTIVAIDDLPRPLFSHSVRVVDAQGNGDGLIQRGETVELVVKISNTGRGRAGKVVANIKNETGHDVFLTEGRAELGALAPGEAKSARFRLKVRDTLKARNVQLKLNIVDQELKVWSQDDLSERVYPDGFPARVARSGVVQVGDTAVVIRAGAHGDAPEIGEAAPASVLALRGGAGDWLEVEWPGSGKAPERGWVAADRVSVGDAGAATPTSVAEVLQSRPPELEVERPELVTSAGHVVIKGVARYASGSNARRQLYIFRGGDKVFFLSEGAAGAARDELPFTFDLPLVDGANALDIVAREDDAHQSSVRFTVFKR